MDEFIEEKREEVKDTLENEGEDAHNVAKEANDDEVVNDKIGVKEEEFEEEALRKVKQEELEDAKDEYVEEMKEEDVEEVDENREGMDASPEEIDQEGVDFEAVSQSADGVGDEEESQEELKQEKVEEEVKVKKVAKRKRRRWSQMSQ